MMMSFIISASVCKAQTIKERLPNGDILLTVDGKDYLAVPPEKAKKLNDSLDELDGLRAAVPLAQKEIVQLRDSLASASERIKAADGKFDEQRLIAGHWKDLYEADHVLLTQAVSLVQNGGRVDSFLNNPIVKLLAQVAVPAVNTILNARR
jgi:hypothetical protein